MMMLRLLKTKALNQLHNVQVDAIKKNQAKQIITDQANSKKQKLIKRLMQQTKKKQQPKSR